MSDLISRNDTQAFKEKIEMNKYEEMTTSDVDVQKVESAKMILEDMNMILAGLRQELMGINSAIYSPGATSEVKKNNSTDDCLLYTLNRQREIARELFDLAIHIREGLW